MEYIKRYDNGLRLVVKPAESLSVAAGIFVNVGSGDETKEQNGISHFAEHMLFKGTKTRSPFEITDSIERIGAQINAYTSKECTCYYTKSTVDHTEETLEILSDIFFNSTFRPEEIERERGVVLEEIAMTEDTPDDLCMELIGKSYFGAHPLGYTILGEADTVANFSRDSVLNHTDNYYNSANTAIVMAGRITFEDAQKFTEKYFLKNFKKSGKPCIKPKAHVSKTNFIYRAKDIEQANICLAFPYVQFDDADTDAYSLLNSILGGTMSSRLFQKIREELGLAYSVHSFPASYVNNGLLTIFAGVNYENLETTIENILNEIEVFKNKGVTKDEFLRAKEQSRSSLIFGQENMSSVMNAYGKYLILTDKLFSIDNKYENIGKLDYDKVNGLCSEMLELQKLCVSFVGKEEYAQKLKNLVNKFCLQ
ncbi:MAG: insulinase family protein [Firmicutes bacterium]|nr:insulinase family protein [Bacillota bacterium]